MERLLLVLLLLPFVSAETVINEVMYNPQGDDNNFEYVEIYSTERLDNYEITDLASSDSLILVKSYESDHHLIVEEGFNYSGIDANIYSVGATIGNNLNNDGDVLVLTDVNGTLVDAFSYTKEFGANGNGL